MSYEFNENIFERRFNLLQAQYMVVALDECLHDNANSGLYREGHF